MPLIPVPGGQRQWDLCECKDSLVYKARSTTVRAAQRNAGLKTIKKYSIKTAKKNILLIF